jgi:transposase
MSSVECTPLVHRSIRDAYGPTHLQNWTRRPKTAQALALRARMILLCGEGKTNTHAAQQIRVRIQTVCKWRQRFIDRRLDGLLDEPCPGTPHKVSDTDIERVLIITLESTPKDATHWSTRSLASASGLSRSTIVGSYLNPPYRAMVLCVDEKSQIQALDRTQPLLPMRPAQVERRTHDYARHGTTSLFAALDVKTGKVIGECHRRHRNAEFRKFLDTIEQAVPKGMDVHLIVDNYGTHKAATIHRWLAKRPRFHVHCTPTSASWINLVERRFAALTEKQIRRGAHRSVNQLEAAIKEYLPITNETPKPFVWTKTADEILASVARFCARTSETGHQQAEAVSSSPARSGPPCRSPL